jgi:hypothetical protein
VLTTGETLTTALRDAHQASQQTIENAVNLRLQAWLYLKQILQEAHVISPDWWKHGDGQVVVPANTEKGPCPLDFANFGTYAQVWMSDLVRELAWLQPDHLEARRQMTRGQRGDPTHYTLKNLTGAGLAQLDVWPTPGRNVTLLLYNYVKKVPELIDCPVSPGVAAGAVGVLDGSYTYRITFTHALGETEGGYVSNVVAPAVQMVDIDPLPISASHAVTGRKVYRTAAGPGFQHKLAATVADNFTPKLLNENLVDGSLGAVCPEAATAITGMELLPADFHELVYVDGLVQLLRAHLKQVPFELFNKQWKDNVRRMWAAQRQDRHVPRAFPPYGGYTTGHRRPRLLS